MTLEDTAKDSERATDERIPSKSMFCISYRWESHPDPMCKTPPTNTSSAPVQPSFLNQANIFSISWREAYRPFDLVPQQAPHHLLFLHSMNQSPTSLQIHILFFWYHCAIPGIGKPCIPISIRNQNFFQTIHPFIQLFHSTRSSQ